MMRPDGPDRWVVQLTAPAEPEVTVEVRMSRETAEKLAAREAARLQALNPGRDDLPPQDVGRAVMHVLGLYASESEHLRMDDFDYSASDASILAVAACLTSSPFVASSCVSV